MSPVLFDVPDAAQLDGNREALHRLGESWDERDERALVNVRYPLDELAPVPA